VHVFLDLRAVAAYGTEAVQARPDGAERGLLGRELVAVVAAAAEGGARLVGPLQTAAVLRDALAILPVADQVALREGDGLHLVGFELLRKLGGRPVVALGAY